MNPFALFFRLHELLADQCGIYFMCNYLEIGIISFFVYKTLSWINNHYTKHIIINIYCYSGVMIGTYIFGLSNVHLLLWCAAPLAIFILILLEQKQIQKNFVLASSKYVSISQRADPDWLESLIRAHLVASYQQKNIFCIIERKVSLQLFFENICMLNVPIKQEVLDLVFKSNALHNPSIITINEYGQLEHINATLKKQVSDMIVLQHEKDIHNIMHMITSKTDAIAFEIDSETKQTTIWHQKTLITKMNIDQLITFCKKILNQKHPNQKGLLYDLQNHERSIESFLDKN